MGIEDRWKEELYRVEQNTRHTVGENFTWVASGFQVVLWVVSHAVTTNTVGAHTSTNEIIRGLDRAIRSGDSIP